MSDEDRPVKRSKRVPPHECTVILVDVGANMNRKGITTTDMELAKEVVEWIITRKIFTESADEFALMLFGSEVTQNSVTDDENIFFYEEEMQRAKIDWLRFIDNEIKSSKSINGNFLAALIAALDYMRNHLENYPKSNITARNILLVTNLIGFDENLDDECINAIINSVKGLEINFSVIGPSIGEQLIEVKDEIILSEESAVKSSKKLLHAMESLKMELAERILANILRQTDGVAYSFAEALPVLQRFLPRKVNLRGQKFYLEIGVDLKFPLQMYKKIQLADFKLGAEKFASTTGIQLKRKTVYKKDVRDKEVENDVVTMNAGSNDNLSQTLNSKIFEKETVKGYKFGTTIVPYNEEDQKEYGWKQENRCLKLIQFTKRSQIFEHYLMDGGTYYLIPPAFDKNACIAISALVNAMIAEDSVALTRFVYNAASQPRIMGLFPRRSKKGVDMFVGIQLPFYEDFRGLDFPSLDNPASEPKRDHLDAMHTFVKAMDLTKAHFNSETGQYEEFLRPRDVPNPKLQNVCKSMKYRALHPNSPLPVFEDKLLGDLLEPNAMLLKLANESLDYLKANMPILESPSKKRLIKETKEEEEELLPRMKADNSALPETGKFIKVDEVDM